MNILFNPRFVEPILDGRKIHTIRENYSFWKRHDGKECSLRVWDGKPYRSPQREFCRKVIFVRKILIIHHETASGDKMPPEFLGQNGRILKERLAFNDGFDNKDEFTDWFYDYPDGELAVLHFTDLRY